MKLGSRRTGTRDGQLVLVSPDLRRALPVAEIAPTLQDALDRWADVEGALRAADERLRSGRVAGVELGEADLLAPLPRAHAWIDCGAYPHPMELLARLNGTETPDPAHARRPPFYDGASSRFVASGEALSTLGSDEMDIEAELGFVLADVELGASPTTTGSAIVGVTVVNDLTLRDVLRADLATGRGIYHAKPPCGMAPTIVTLDELGDAWDGEHVHAQMYSWINGQLIGHPHTGADIAATVPELIAQAARTRQLSAGTVLGTGTVSNRDPAAGAACIAELRIRETLAQGSPSTPFLRPGDELVIDLRVDERSVAGALRHTITGEPAHGAGPHELPPRVSNSHRSRQRAHAVPG